MACIYLPHKIYSFFFFHTYILSLSLMNIVIICRGWKKKFKKEKLYSLDLLNGSKTKQIMWSDIPGFIFIYQANILFQCKLTLLCYYFNSSLYMVCINKSIFGGGKRKTIRATTTSIHVYYKIKLYFQLCKLDDDRGSKVVVVYMNIHNIYTTSIVQISTTK